jgi:hypothetical protein
VDRLPAVFDAIVYVRCGSVRCALGDRSGVGFILGQIPEDSMIPAIWTRLAIYFGVVAFLTAGWFAVEWLRSSLAYRRGDLSAFAWMGFAPFIIPLMATWITGIAVPLVVVFEVLIWLEFIK